MDPLNAVSDSVQALMLERNDWVPNNPSLAVLVFYPIIRIVPQPNLCYARGGKSGPNADLHYQRASRPMR